MGIEGEWNFKGDQSKHITNAIEDEQEVMNTFCLSLTAKFQSTELSKSDT
jgi:hypothetical protein